MAELQLLASGDSAAFEALLQMLMSAQNEQRSHAEQIFGEFKKAAPDACASQLIRSLRHSTDLQSRSLCAVMLRKVCMVSCSPSLMVMCCSLTFDITSRECSALPKQPPPVGVCTGAHKGRPFTLALPLRQHQGMAAPPWFLLSGVLPVGGRKWTGAASVLMRLQALLCLPLSGCAFAAGACQSGDAELYQGGAAAPCH